MEAYTGNKGPGKPPSLSPISKEAQKKKGQNVKRTLKTPWAPKNKAPFRETWAE